jgi:allantoinase
MHYGIISGAGSRIFCARRKFTTKPWQRARNWGPKYWFGDWVLDDQPQWVGTANGPICAVPYSSEINDITMMVSHHHESRVLFERTRDAFDRLYEESAESTRILAVGVHPYVTGQSHRIKYFEDLYAYINGHEGVVHMVRGPGPKA